MPACADAGMTALDHKLHMILQSSQDYTRRIDNMEFARFPRAFAYITLTMERLDAKLQQAVQAFHTSVDIHANASCTVMLTRSTVFVATSHLKAIERIANEYYLGWMAIESAIPSTTFEATNPSDRASTSRPALHRESRNALSIASSFPSILDGVLSLSKLAGFLQQDMASMEFKQSHPTAPAATLAVFELENACPFAFVVASLTVAFVLHGTWYLCSISVQRDLNEALESGAASTLRLRVNLPNMARCSTTTRLSSSSSRHHGTCFVEWDLYKDTVHVSVASPSAVIDAAYFA
ncbi:hypothetical protein, variant [Aphanomyces astaci]|uniref:Uncharacterized protein n=1 Tax=Aphanomyces astaci TaxID=112090 RepID=W4HDS4_APHAT|nr:hypothetical protein, variant [Aphanomyces astaci]ETV89746.1 hypothetical protein, variant [Aphanomyces astaci]|eukprot:XP_009822146.1 hypothetical protein, variant [Aphanomyces astaci]